MHVPSILRRSLFVATVLTGAISGQSQSNPEAQKLASVKHEADHGPFQSNWDSLSHYQIPAWYQDAKFGIFIHWGAYSVPAFGSEWYPREMYIPGMPKKVYEHHLQTNGPLDKFGYKDFIPLFKGEKFDPVAWARLFKESGARYVIPVAEHHDGFPMYDSAYTVWNAAKMGPKRDVIAELSRSIRAEGLHFGVSSHRAENWWFYGGGRKIKSDVQDDRYRALYGPARDREESESGKTPPDQSFLDNWLLRCVELVDKYQPEIVWFDWWIASPAFSQNLQIFSAYYYNRSSHWPNMGAINYKAFGGESFPDTAGVLDIERGGLADIRSLYWQTDTSVSKTSWGYVTNQDYKTVNSLVDDLVDIVSKNGCMLLNIGPRPDGTIPEPEQQMLREIGVWLKQNGEAIYDTRPWIKFGEGSTQVADGKMTNDAEHRRKDFGKDDVRFTRNGDTVYAILLDWPGDQAKITIRSLTPAALPNGIKAVTMLGSASPLTWTVDAQGLHVTLPAKAPGLHAYALKITPERK